jgi:hypothetical protein
MLIFQGLNEREVISFQQRLGRLHLLMPIHLAVNPVVKSVVKSLRLCRLRLLMHMLRLLRQYLYFCTREIK